MPKEPQPVIAIIGMSGRFPDAPDVETFWRNLERGHESLTTFSDQELQESGIPPEILAHPQFVRKGTIVEGSDLFDASFFGFNPREAEVIDPQHRMLLECAWQAMEDAGYGAGDCKNVGVYAGASYNTYVGNLFANREVLESAGLYQVFISSDKDFLATRIGYKLDLRGPCLTLQTACSTSLVAVHVACQALLARECDMALAGGVALRFPQKSGHMYQPGMILSPDAHCRPFDADGAGIRSGEGAGLVVLKRVEDARRDGDTIRGLILATSVNNDGADKIGYTAPSVNGQIKVLSHALAVSGIDPGSVSYIEAHGTATPLGDTIEFAGLSQVYGNASSPCAIGAVKSNIGHLDIAAGVAGLIKTLLAFKHRSIPPTLHFKRVNPQLQWEGSRFYINTSAQEWISEQTPRRAAVSSFGIGGTNAHVVLEEAPAPEASRILWPDQLLVLSAVTASALETAAQNLAAHLEAHPDLSLADLCYTLQAGRTRFPHRRALVCSSLEQLKGSLQSSGPSSGAKEFTASVSNISDRSVAFMFPGQGSQYHAMGRDLYAVQPTFRRWFDRCAEVLEGQLGIDLRGLLYGPQASAELNDTRLAQPLLFAIEYSLARMWMRFGIQPTSMIGHSVGEFVAACLAGVFSLEDGLRIIAFRGQLMQSQPRGSMLSVAAGEGEVLKLLTGACSIAAVNGRSLCVVAGPDQEIAGLQQRLDTKGIPCSRLHTSHAFHSSMMEPAVPVFREFLSTIPMRRPSIPFVSNVTGAWITPEEATNPEYWAKHLRQKIHFAQGVKQLASSGSILLEVGPGQTLATFARECEAPENILTSLPHAKDPQPAARVVLNTLGKMWAGGVAIDWQGVHEEESLHRIPLPTYPFERSRFFVKPGIPVLPVPQPAPPERLDFEDWFYVPSWKRTLSPAVAAGEISYGPWLIFADTSGLADSFARTLAARGEQFVRVSAGKSFVAETEGSYSIDPSSAEHYQKLLADLILKRQIPRSVLFGWGLSFPRESLHHLLHLAQAVGEQGLQNPIDLLVVSAGMHKVHGDEAVDPDLALMLGPVKTIPAEYPNVQCRSIDLGRGDDLDAAAALLAAEPALPAPLHVVAYRNGFRWEQTFEAAHLPAATDQIRTGGTYLITGGTGGIGLTLARYLATFRTRLALVSRTATPPRADWAAWLETHAPDDSASGRIQELLALEALGAEILPLAADVSNPGEMREAIDAIHKNFGAIDGIIHAAGIAGAGLIQIKAAAAAEKVLAPKVSGTQNLLALTREDPVDFILLCSSVNSILGMVGGVDYTSANAYLDAQAAADSRGRVVLMSVNWDAWQEVGMAVNTRVPAEMQAARLASLKHAIRPAEGVEVFRRVLSARIPQVLVVTRDMANAAKQAEGIAPAPQQTAAPDADAGNGYVRPELSTPFEAPENQIQQTIAKIWQEALGHARVGLDDNFFELGGHSLIATSILARVRSAFNVNLPLRVIFESPTVRTLAVHVETLTWNASHGGETTEDAGDREEVEI